MTKTIAITGVSRGLGGALTEEFIKLGHTVIGCARSPSQIQELQLQYNKPHIFAVVDVADETQVKNWANLFRNSPPDLLINNAALINNPAPLWQVPSKEFSQLIDVNIKGVANVIREVVPMMIKQSSGIIVNISSGWGRSTSPDVAPYCASKWAIEGLNQALAQELPSGIATIAVNPGIIQTEMLNICFGDEAEFYTPVETWVKKAVPFLLKLSPKDNGKSLSIA